MKITIDNFRGFKNQTIDFKKISILIGENSAGKSSLIKLLLSLKQTIVASDGMNWKLSGKYVDLGSYKDIVADNKVSNDIIIKFTMQEELLMFYSNFFVNNFDLTSEEVEIINKTNDDFSHKETTIQIKFTKALDSKESMQIEIQNECFGSIQLSIKDIDKPTVANAGLLSIVVNRNKGIKNQNLDILEYTREGFLLLADTTSLFESCRRKFPKKHIEIFYQLSYLLLAQNVVKEFLAGIRYSNPVLTTTKRYYILDELDHNQASLSTRGVVSLLTNKKISIKTRENVRKILNNVISEFGLAEEIIIEQSTDFPIAQIKVKQNGKLVHLSDVGYGVSLQIPIFLQAIISSNSKSPNTHIIEQPEIHLHPKLHSKFIDVLLAASGQTPLIIETHSEYILRKIQSIIKNKTHGLESTDVAIFYMRRNKNKFEVINHQINTQGELIPNLPEEFTDNSYRLTLEIL